MNLFAIIAIYSYKYGHRPKSSSIGLNLLPIFSVNPSGYACAKDFKYHPQEPLSSGFSDVLTGPPRPDRHPQYLVKKPAMKPYLVFTGPTDPMITTERLAVKKIITFRSHQDRFKKSGLTIENGSRQGQF